MKKLFIMVSSIILVLSIWIVTPIVEAQEIATPYKDHAEIDQWKRTAVNYVYDKGIMQGDSGNFYPKRSLTRAEIAKIVAVSLDLDIPTMEKSALNFTDMKNHWASPYVKALQEYNSTIIKGYGDGTFKPNQEIRKDELVKILVTTFTIEATKDFYVNYPDINNWAKEYIEIFVLAGIAPNTESKTFNPEISPTREDVATYIYSTLEESKRVRPLLNVAITKKATQIDSTKKLVLAEQDTIYQYGFTTKSKMYNGIKLLTDFTEVYYDKNKNLITSEYFMSDDVGYFVAIHNKTKQKYIYEYVQEQVFTLEDELIIEIDSQTTESMIGKEIVETLQKRDPTMFSHGAGVDIDSYIYDPTKRLYVTLSYYKTEELYNKKDKAMIEVDGFKYYINSLYLKKK